MPRIAFTSFIRKMNAGGSNKKMRSKISRGSAVNETESIFGSKSSGVDEDWFLSECPRFALAVRFDRFAQSNVDNVDLSTATSIVHV